MPVTAEQLVRREVYYCVSSLVSTLACSATAANELNTLCDQAFELSASVEDFEEAAREAGWEDVTTDDYPPCTQFEDKTDGMKWACSGWQQLCEDHDIEPYYREVFEFWIVSDWLADELIAHDEKVDKDFAGLTVWARTTTGQSIASDSVIQAIVSELNK